MDSGEVLALDKCTRLLAPSVVRTVKFLLSHARIDRSIVGTASRSTGSSEKSKGSKRRNFHNKDFRLFLAMLGDASDLVIELFSKRIV